MRSLYSYRPRDTTALSRTGSTPPKLTYLLSHRGVPLFSRQYGAWNERLWLVCPPGLEESIHARSSLTALSAQLALHDVSTFTVDYEGDGLSEGDISEVGLDDWADDVLDGLTTTSRSPEAIVGFRLGALVAMFAAERARPRHLILVDPIADGEAWLLQALRSNLTTQLTAFRAVREPRNAMLQRVLSGDGTCNILGYDIGRRFAKSAVSLRTDVIASRLNTLCQVNRLDLVYSSASLADAARTLRTSLDPKIGTLVIDTPGPPAWSEAAMASPQGSSLVNSLLRLVER